jgi:hypothetical protein
MMAVSTPTTYNLILMNPNATDSKLSLSFPDTVCRLSAFRTSGTEDFAAGAKGKKVEQSHEYMHTCIDIIHGEFDK